MPLVSWLVPANPVETQRSGGWTALRLRFLRTHPFCECCNKSTELEVHHVIPVSVDASLELIEENLICLCERCHLVVGHLNNWHRWNPHIRHDAALLKSRHSHEQEVQATIAVNHPEAQSKQGHGDVC